MTLSISCDQYMNVKPHTSLLNLCQCDGCRQWISHGGGSMRACSCWKTKVAGWKSHMLQEEVLWHVFFFFMVKDEASFVAYYCIRRWLHEMLWFESVNSAEVKKFQQALLRPSCLTEWCAIPALESVLKFLDPKPVSTLITFGLACHF